MAEGGWAPVMAEGGRFFHVSITCLLTQLAVHLGLGGVSGEAARLKAWGVGRGAFWFLHSFEPYPLVNGVGRGCCNSHV